MDLAASELWKLFQGCSGILVRGGAGGQCDEGHSSVWSLGLVLPRYRHLQLLDGRNGFGRDEIQVMVDAAQLLDGI